MIDFRYHIVSIVAVFLALALGLFLGSTTLQSTVTDNLRSQAHHVNDENQTLTTKYYQEKSLVGQANAFATSVEPYAVQGRLASDSVAVISAPGVDGGDRDHLETALTEAGATVTADIRLSSAYLDPAQDAELGNLARELAGSRKLPKGNGAAQASYELAHALLARPSVPAPSQSRVAVILNALTDGKMLKVSGSLPVHPADLAVLLVPGTDSSLQPADQTQQNTVLTDLAQELRSASSGLVVAGPTAVPAAPGGPLDAARADNALTAVVSTVDSDHTTAGQIAVVLALAAAPGGTVGTFGYGNGAAPLPTPSSSP